MANEINDSDLAFVEASKAVKDKNYVTAITIFETLANNAEHDAQYNLAVLQKSGKGRPQNYKAALKWAWLSSLGNIELANNLVEELKDLLPELVIKAVRESVKDFLKPRALEGDFPAMKQMGEYFLIVPEEPDYQEAYLWFLIATAFQIDGAMNKRDEVENEIEAKDIIKVQEAASQLYSEIYQKIE